MAETEQTDAAGEVKYPSAGEVQYSQQRKYKEKYNKYMSKSLSMNRVKDLDSISQDG